MISSFILFLLSYIIIILWTRQFFLLLIGSILLHDIVRLYEYIYTVCSLKRRCIIIPALMYRGSSSGVGRRQDEGTHGTVIARKSTRFSVKRRCRRAFCNVEVTAPGCSWASSWRAEAATGSPCSSTPSPLFCFPHSLSSFFIAVTSSFFPLNRLSRASRRRPSSSPPPSSSSSLTRPSHPSSQVCIVRPARARPATADFVEPVPNRFVRASLARSACDGERASSDLTGIRRESTREKSGRALIRGAIRDTWYALTHTRAPWFLTDPGRIPLSSNHPRVNHSRRWWEKSECLANVFHGVSRGTFAGRQNVRY